MNPISPRRRRREAEAYEYRYKFCARVGRCEHCLLPAPVTNLCIDEIARGTSHRQKALDQPYAFLVVRADHHRLIQDWSRAKRLALLYLARSTDFDLEKWYTLTGRRWPDWEDIEAEIELLLQARNGSCKTN